MRQGEIEMIDEYGDHKTLRHYLLGKLKDDRTMSRLEMRIMSDDDFADEITAAESELMEDYLDGSLNTEDSSQFVRHFLASPERKRQLRLTQNLRKYSAQAETAPNPKRSRFDLTHILSIQWLRFAALAVVVIAAGFGIWRFAIYQSDADKSVAQLRKAYQGQRPLEPRITALPDYVPYSETRGPAPTAADPDALRRAEVYLLEATQNPNNAKAHQAQGSLNLAQKKYDEAIREFTLALISAPNDAKIHSDIGATYFERAKQADLAGKPDGNLQDLALSLQSLSRALELDSSLTEALFDKALVLQKMHLSGQAKEAWEKYLQKDSTSPWADEARHHLEGLDSKSSTELSGDEKEEHFIAAFRTHNNDAAFTLISQNRELIREKYLPQKLAISLVKAGPAEREMRLAALKYLGSLEKDRIGDNFASDLGAYYSTLSEQKLELLRQAQDTVINGYKLCLEQNKFAAAMEQFSIARALFLKAGDAIESDTICKYFIAYCLYNLDQRLEADGLLRQVGDFCDKKDYRWFALMNYYWWLGSQESLGYRSFTETRRTYESLLQQAQNMGDLYMTQKFLEALVLKSNFVNQEGKTFEYTKKILTISDQPNLSVRQKIRNLNQIIAIYSQTRFPSFAQALVLESVSIAKTTTDPAFVIGAEMNAGIVHTQTEDFPEAEKWLVKARKDSEALPEESARKRNLASILLNIGRLEYKRQNYLQAKDYYEQSLTNSNSMKTPLIAYETHKARLKTLQNLEGDADLSNEISATLHLAEDYRKTLLNEKERNSFYTNEQDVYDAAVDFAFSNKDFEGAYNLAETSTSRSLLDLLDKGAKVSTHDDQAEILFGDQLAVPLDLAEIRERLPAEVQILQFRVLDKQVLIWLISRDQFLTFSSPVGAVQLEAKVKDYYRLLNSKNTDNQDELRKISLDLYALLVKPVRTFLSDDKEICIVPNRILFYLPFASLVSSENKYFLEEFTSFYAPSANLFVRSTDIASEKSGMTHEKLLSVGNPAFDNVEFPILANLPDSKGEALVIAKDYTESKVLYEKGATKEAFQKNYKDYEIIHFAGHYLIEPGSSLASKLIMAKSSENANDNVLTNGEIIGEKLSKTKLVVLAACATGVEGSFFDEGLAGLSRTFLATGVPVVVASEWQVDSAATRELMQNFHRYRTQEKLSSVRSLQRAQLDMAGGSNPAYRQPYFWAAFAAFGGYANF